MNAAAVPRWRAAIPEQLWQLPVWLLWKRKPKKDKPGKFDKIPFYANGYQRHGGNGSPEDRAQLVELGDALATYQKCTGAAHFDGIGMALLPDVEVWALDLDDCIDAAGNLSALAQRVVASGSYAERSPSGTGVRALYSGKAGIDAKNHHAGVEVFDSRGFVTVTGEAFKTISDSEIVSCPPDLLAEILAIVRAGRPKTVTESDTVSSEVATSSAPPENPALARSTRLPAGLARYLANPYPGNCDRSATAFKLALQLRRVGLSPAQALEVLSTPQALAPALERRRGDIASAREWMWRYCVQPAYQQ